MDNPSFLFEQRCKEILSQKQKVDERINKLTALKSKWNTIDSFVKYSGYIVFLLTGLASTIGSALMTAGINVPHYMILKTSSVGILIASIAKVVSKTLTSSKKNKYKNQIEELNSCSDKMYLFFEKARSDLHISNEEIEEFLALKKKYLIEEPDPHWTGLVSIPSS